MKKIRILALILALTMAISTLVGCGGKKATDNGDNDTIKNEQIENNSSVVTGKIVNEDGEEFTANIETKGDIKDGISVNSKEVTISGKTYTFPIKISDLLNDGWNLSDNLEFKNEFEAKRTTSLTSFDLYNEDGSEISLRSLYNDTNEVQKFEDCILTGLTIHSYEDVGFVFPGGITEMSTAADVLSVYGDPNKTTLFDSGYNLEEQLTYVGHKETNFRISYSFNEDGTLYGASIELEY